MINSFKLPDLGEGIHEGEVITVKVSPGQRVTEGDIILEVETDKAAVEIPTPFTGQVKEILVKVGDVVNVGDVLMTFETAGNAADVRHQPAPRPASPRWGEEKPAEDVRFTLSETGPRKGPVPASPATRRLARELGVDLHLVPPTGRGGVVTSDDVRGFGEKQTQKSRPAEPKVPEPPPVKPLLSPDAEVRPISPDAPPLPDFSRWGVVERKPLRSIRRTTARHMALAWSQIPHVTSTDTVDITELEAFRSKHKDTIRARGGRLTLTVFALKAAVSALKAFPNFNASLDTSTGEVILKKYYHIGVAVDTDDGLIVPVIRDVDRKSITEISVELDTLIQKTRERKTAVEDLQGGSFTITNIGSLGGGHFSPIINYPQAAIMGMGQARLQPVVRETASGRPEIVPRLMMPLVLTIDHRMLDGADAARFMNFVVKSLQDPEELMLTMV